MAFLWTHFGVWETDGQADEQMDSPTH